MSGLEADLFEPCRAHLETLIGFLNDASTGLLSHAELEDRVQVDGREIVRLALQGHLDVRADAELRLVEVTDTEGVARSTVEGGHERGLNTVVGPVTVTRRAYRRRAYANLHPADGTLNLPTGRYSHGVRELAAIESTRGSFDGAVDAISRFTGLKVGKRQVEELAVAAAADFDAFYRDDKRPEPEPDDVVVLSAYGKGIVMRPDSLRPATADAAEKTEPKLKTRISKGEKRNRKRLAEVGAVYHLAPVPRDPADIMTPTTEKTTAEVPAAKDKWLMASVVDDCATVIAQIFTEAERRDPSRAHPWIALVDGNNHQIQRITKEAATRGIDVTVIVDFIHVLEYIWKAAWCFHNEGDPAAETWVRTKADAVLNGDASTVAASIRRKATCQHLDADRRRNADTCADYLLHKRRYLDYPTALENGWPIATGVIEGACRHLVKDRMDLTGARWSAPGAEAILKLRAIRTNNDWPKYWQFHLTQERHRVHETRYANHTIPTAA